MIGREPDAYTGTTGSDGRRVCEENGNIRFDKRHLCKCVAKLLSSHVNHTYKKMCEYHLFFFVTFEDYETLKKTLVVFV